MNLGTLEMKKKEKKQDRIEEMRMHVKILDSKLNFARTESTRWRKGVFESLNNIDYLLRESMEGENELDPPEKLKDKMAQAIANRLYPDLDPPIDVSNNSKIQDAIKDIFLMVAPYLNFEEGE